MPVKLILDRFNIYNSDDPDVTNHGLPAGIVDKLPFFQIRFLVKSPYYSENMDGEFQLIRDYRRKLNKVKDQFAKQYGSKFDDLLMDTLDEFEGLKQLGVLVRKLEHMIQTDIVVKDKIKLDTIQLLGAWPVYDTKEDQSPLEQEFKQQTDAKLKDIEH
ncbi:MAG: hypothetical protein LKF37_06965 [Lentilactobacillus diolivorans]|jgi:hypothetical protein|nr:hypothetical protein [Lentilactobacillus diolivorans]RRG03101.1 MAG: hypothetical protein DUD34_05885 [Lactobacillus sp.]